jgi:hypothetical protein
MLEESTRQIDPGSRPIPFPYIFKTLLFSVSSQR